RGVLSADGPPFFFDDCSTPGVQRCRPVRRIDPAGYRLRALAAGRPQVSFRLCRRAAAALPDRPCEPVEAIGRTTRPRVASDCAQVLVPTRCQATAGGAIDRRGHVAPLFVSGAGAWQTVEAACHELLH